MPVMDGLEATHAIRALDVAWRGLPIVACTAAVFDDDRRSSLASGMTDFLEKPVRLVELERVLRRHLGRTDRDAA